MDDFEREQAEFAAAMAELKRAVSSLVRTVWLTIAIIAFSLVFLFAYLFWRVHEIKNAIQLIQP